MDATFETIGLEIPSEKAINFLAERAENQGEPTQILRREVLQRALLEDWARVGSLDGALRIRDRRRLLRQLPPVFAPATRSASVPGP
jgi:hypothetical protein